MAVDMGFVMKERQWIEDATNRAEKGGEDAQRNQLVEEE